MIGVEGLATVGALALLAVMDCGFVGFRSAAGRNPKIHKRAYYRRAIRRGLLGGAGSLTIVSLVAGGALAGSADPAAVWASYLDGGAVLLAVYGAYTALVMGAFVIYALPIMDLRILMSVSIFGPLTLLRPYVITAGLCGAMWAAPGWPVAASAIAVAVCSLGIEPLYDRLWRRGWFSDAGEVVGAERGRS